MPRYSKPHDRAEQDRPGLRRFDRIDEPATPLRKAVKCFCEIIGCRIAQIVAGELDVPLERVSVMMGDTAWTMNQGGASGSTRVQKGGIPLRTAAAEGVSRGITFSVSEAVPQGSAVGNGCRVG